MSFANQFATYFTAEQRETELYQLWSTIGQNMEKSIVEEQNKLNAELTDINNFSEDTLRSWLAFFLMRIPYRTTATVQVTTSMPGNFLETEIPQYAELTTDDGITYTQLEKVTLSKGDTRVVTAVQGIRVVEQGTYSNIIKVQATNPDLTYLTVKIGNQEIPEVSYETSYDQLLFRGSWKPQTMSEHEYGGTPYLQNQYGTKGEFYTVIADGKAHFTSGGLDIEFVAGDLVVFDGQQWQRSAYNNNLNAIQFANSYAVPRNGYFAYYFGGYLYIKIFSGSEISDPNGQQFEVSYIQSDGVQGEIAANTLHYVSNYEDSDENVVTLEVSNTKSTAAVNQPSRGKLGIYLKQRLYSSINVASVPEYTNWFKAQPEVGDCLVLSDYERWVREGKPVGGLVSTGIVDVYLVDPSGEELDVTIKEKLLERIEPYKDIAVVQIREFTPVEQHLIFEYTSSGNDEQFKQYIKSRAALYYDLAYLQSTNSSIFGDLDLAAIIKDIQDNSPYSSTGLIVKGYHYKKEQFSSKAPTITSYDGELPGKGWYIFTVPDSAPAIYTKTEPDGTITEIRSVRFEEVESPSGDSSCTIYYDDPIQQTVRVVGVRTTSNATFTLTSFVYSMATIECYWGMKNEGILSVGASNGIRKLQDIEVNRVSE